MSNQRVSMGCRDLISSLPDEVLGKVLSLLPTKLAASTSVLSKRWSNLLALVDNLDFNDASGGDPRVFSDFVDKTLALLSNSSMAKRFYLNCQHKHDKSRVDSWIRAVLERGFLELGLKTECLVTNLLFTSNTLVKLTSSSAFYHPDGVLPLPLEGVFSFPALKTLSLSLSIGFINVKHEEDIIRKHRDMYAFLISACPVLEELVLHYGDFLSWSFMSTCPSIAVSSPSIKRLTISYHLYGRYPPKAEWFRTPSLVYLDYSGHITGEYVVDLASLVEAKLDLRSRTSPLHGYVITYDDSYYGGEDNGIGCGDECHRFGVEYAVSYSACGEDDDTEVHYDHIFGGDGDSDGDGDGDDDAEDVLGDGDGDAEDVLSDVTVLVAGISNVKTLHLSCYSLEVFHFYCTSIPVFHNLLTLSFESHTFKGWQVVPLLLNNSPNLETLIIKGLMHRPTESCGDACPCIPRKKKKMEEEVCCLSTCHVKVLNISGYGGTRRERKMMWHFLGNLKCLETVKVGVEPEDYQRRLCLEDLKRCVNFKVGVEAENHREDSNVKAYRQRITNALMRLPKASLNCQIHVFFETK